MKAYFVVFYLFLAVWAAIAAGIQTYRDAAQQKELNSRAWNQLQQYGYLRGMMKAETDVDSECYEEFIDKLRGSTSETFEAYWEKNKNKTCAELVPVQDAFLFNYQLELSAFSKDACQSSSSSSENLALDNRISNFTECVNNTFCETGANELNGKEIISKLKNCSTKHLSTKGTCDCSKDGSRCLDDDSCMIKHNENFPWIEINRTCHGVFINLENIAQKCGILITESTIGEDAQPAGDYCCSGKITVAQQDINENILRNETRNRLIECFYKSGSVNHENFTQFFNAINTSDISRYAKEIRFNFLLSLLLNFADHATLDWAAVPGNLKNLTMDIENAINMSKSLPYHKTFYMDGELIPVEFNASNSTDMLQMHFEQIFEKFNKNSPCDCSQARSHQCKNDTTCMWSAQTPLLYGKCTKEFSDEGGSLDYGIITTYLGALEGTPAPTAAPTVSPTRSPTAAPTDAPTTKLPTESPTDVPTNVPTGAPTDMPTTSTPTATPTRTPTAEPTASPIDPTSSPTASPVTPTTPPTECCAEECKAMFPKNDIVVREEVVTSCADCLTNKTDGPYNFSAFISSHNGVTDKIINGIKFNDRLSSLRKYKDGYKDGDDCGFTPIESYLSSVNVTSMSYITLSKVAKEQSKPPWRCGNDEECLFGENELYIPDDTACRGIKEKVDDYFTNLESRTCNSNTIHISF